MSDLERQDIATTSGSIVIPCSPQDFGKFIAGLLSSTKVIRFRRNCHFVIYHNDLLDILTLIIQRIHDQHEYSIAEKFFIIDYFDGTTFTYHSESDFMSHRELNSSECVGITMRLAFLLTLPDSDVPKKQSVEVRFSTGVHELTFEDRSGWINLSPRSYVSYAGFSVEHSHISFGNDMANLLKSRLNSTGGKNRLLQFLRYEPVKMGWLALVSSAFLLFVLPFFISFSDFVEHNQPQALAKLISSGSFFVGALYVTLAGILLGATLLAGASLIYDHAIKLPPSLIVLDDSKKEAAERKQKQHARRPWALIWGTISVVALGLLSNWIFALLT